MRKFPIYLLIFNLFIIDCQKVEEQKEGITIKGTFSKQDVDFFVQFVKEMENAVAQKDIEKCLSFYSENFLNEKNLDKNKARENTQYVFDNYTNIKYKMKNLVANVKNDKAVSVDEFEYSAYPIDKKLDKLEFKGKERIYWIKENNEWKIVNWVIE